VPLPSFVLLAAICLVWACNTVVSKIVLGGMGVPPLWYAALRSLVVLVALLPWLRPLPARLGQVVLVTFAISGGSFGLYFVGLRDATPSTAAVVSLSGAPLTVLLAIAILGEKVRWRRGLGIALSFAGVGVAVASPSAWSSSTGLVFVFLSALAGSLGAVFLKRIELGALNLQAWAALGSVVVLFPLSFALERGQVVSVVEAGWRFWAALAFTAGAVSLGAHTLYFRLLQRYDANVVAPLTLMTPIFTIALGAWITDDPVGQWLVFGAALAGAGVLVILVRPSGLVFKPLLVRPRL
jgi:O-acetylserine/cysteine efflux transporter